MPPILGFTGKRPAMVTDLNDICREAFVVGVTDPKPVEINAKNSLVSSGLGIRPRFMIILYCLFS